jgi:hypothetical protein
MSDEFNELNLERPLDTLLPDLGETKDLVVRTLHTRVLNIESDTGWQWVFVCWENPGDFRTLHNALKPIVESSLLSHLTQPLGQETADNADFREVASLCFVQYPAIEGDLVAALMPFGFTQETMNRAFSSPVESAIKREADLLDLTLPNRPSRVWTASVSYSTHQENINALERHLRMTLKDQAWGTQPGHPTKALQDAWKSVFGHPLSLSSQGMNELEMVMIQQQAGTIRWIPCRCFQAICDYIGVLTLHQFNLPLQWGDSSPDESGFCAPPLLRWEDAAGDVQHLNLGVEFLRWSIMPLQPNESCPSLGDWVFSLLSTDNNN